MTNKRVSRRNFLKAAVVSSAGALLAACTSPAATTEAPKSEQPAAEEPQAEQPKAEQPAAKQVTLKVLAENWGEVYDNLMMKIGDSYMEENPNIKVEWEFDPDWRTKLTTLLAANTPPDLAFMRPDFLASVAPRGVLIALDDYLAAAGAKREEFITAMYDSGSYEGKLYAIPGGADYWCLFYSKDIYKDVGLDPEKPPASMIDIVDHTNKIKKLDADGNIERMGLIYNNWYLPQWMFNQGGQLYDIQNKKITANHPKNVEAYTWLKNYFQSMGDIDKLTAFAQRPGFFDAGNPFATRNVAYVTDGFWYYEAIDQHAPDLDYGVTFWPTPTGAEEERKNWMLGGWHYSLAKGIPNPDESWKLMRYMFYDKSAKMGYETLNGTCVIAQFKEWEEGVKSKMGANNRMAPYLHFFTETGGYAVNYFPIIPNQSFYQDELSRVFDLMMRNQMDPQAALDEVTKNVQADLDKILSGG